MENENIKNELNIINVGGHRVKTSSTGDATFKVRGKLKKFKSFDLRPPYNFIEAMNKVKSSSPSNWRRGWDSNPHVPFRTLVFKTSGIAIIRPLQKLCGTSWTMLELYFKDKLSISTY